MDLDGTMTEEENIDSGGLVSISEAWRHPLSGSGGQVDW